MIEYHVLERTSPKGGPSISRCIRCGMTGLPMSAVWQECKNIKEMTADEALVKAVTGEQTDEK